MGVMPSILPQLFKSEMGEKKIQRIFSIRIQLLLLFIMDLSFPHILFQIINMTESLFN